MPWLAAVIGAAGSIATAATAGATGVGKVDPKTVQYKGPNAQSYGYGGEGSDFFGRGMNPQMNQDLYARGNQMALIQQLQQMAAGTGPSAAQAQLQAGRDAAIANVKALSASNRGGGYGASQMDAVNAAAKATGDAANNAAILKAQEQQFGMNALGQNLAGMSKQYGEDAGRMNQLSEFFLSLGQTREQAALNARIAMEQESGDAWRAYQNAKLGVATQNAARDAQWVSGIGQGFAQLGASAGAFGGGDKPPAKG